MKHILTILVILSMTACGMSIEEYNARVKYCNDMQSLPKAGEQGFGIGPTMVYCEKDGILFNSKETK